METSIKLFHFTWLGYKFLQLRVVTLDACFLGFFHTESGEINMYVVSRTLKHRTTHKNTNDILHRQTIRRKTYNTTRDNAIRHTIIECRNVALSFCRSLRDYATSIRIPNIPLSAQREGMWRSWKNLANGVLRTRNLQSGVMGSTPGSIRLVIMVRLIIISVIAENPFIIILKMS